MSDAYEINDVENQCILAGLSFKQLINQPMDNVGIVYSGACGGSKYIHNIYV